MAKNYLLIVERDEQTRKVFKRALEQYPSIEFYMTSSIMAASVKYISWIVQGCFPRAVICDWDMNILDEECTHLDKRDNCQKGGAHFLLSECSEASEHGLLIAYTTDPIAASIALGKSLEATRVQVASRQNIAPRDLIGFVVAKAFEYQKQPIQLL